MQRIVCHLDMDAFFASVEEKFDPGLKGKPVVVAAGPVGRGAVASSNYIARKLGIKTGMSTREAIRQFPQAVVVRANYDRYQEASREILRVIYRYTPDVEPLSLDESFFELTHVRRWQNDPRAAAEAIQQTVERELQLSASIGISSGKALAKIASDFKKPHGITVVPFGYERDWIETLPVEAVPGVGRATYKKLMERGIRSCGDICGMSPGLLHTLFGQVHGSFLWNLAHGRDERPLTHRSSAKSISHQSTLQRTTSNKEYVESLLLYIAERCLWRLRASRMSARGVSIYLRFAHQQFAGRVSHLKCGTQAEQIVLPVVSNMTHDIWAGRSQAAGASSTMWPPATRALGVTFVGVSLFDFQPVGDQENLFVDDMIRKETLSRVLGEIRGKFGDKIIATARTYPLHQNYRLSQAGLSFSTEFNLSPAPLLDKEREIM